MNLSTIHTRLHIFISSEDKTTIAWQHTSPFHSINNTGNLILYTDGSELQTGGVVAGVVMLDGGRIVGRWSIEQWRGIKVYDGELAGIARALTETSRTSLFFKHIWIFTDNQAAIRNSLKLSPHPGQLISLQIQQLTKHLLDSNLDLQLHLHSVPGHTQVLKAMIKLTNLQNKQLSIPNPYRADTSHWQNWRHRLDILPFQSRTSTGLKYQILQRADNLALFTSILQLLLQHHSTTTYPNTNWQKSHNSDLVIVISNPILVE